jgi:hypothetical protein
MSKAEILNTYSISIASMAKQFQSNSETKDAF